MAQVSLTIVGGPGKFDLMLALFEGKEMSFSSLSKNDDGSSSWRAQRINAHITAIESEDGSHESWNLKGYVSGSLHSTPFFHAYYTTRGNTGTLTME